MPDTATEQLAPGREGLERAANILRSGQLVAFPTETVYGLGADARNDRAVARIFEAKQRPRFNPLIIHVASVEEAQDICTLDPAALKLARAFWPGPLTLVAPLKAECGLSPLVTAGLQTVAIRVPAHPIAQGLLGAFGGPVAAPSANPSGRISPTRASHVLDGLAGRIAAVVDGGACSVGVESTIVETGTPPRLLRQGGVPEEAIAKVLGTPLARPETGRITAPGQLTSHYAPEAQLRLNVTDTRPGETLIGFGPVTGDLNLSDAGNLVEAAANLFHMLRAADALGRPIAVAPVPDRGLGRAINDRLRRAAAPRNDGSASE